MACATLNTESSRDELATVIQLLKSKADVHIKEVASDTWKTTGNGKTPDEVAKCVISKFMIRTAGAEGNDKNKYVHEVVLSAIQKERTDFLEVLLELGANVNTEDTDKKTPLHTIAEKGAVELCDTLLLRQADINFKDIRLQTPLHLAADKGHTEIVESLIGAKVLNDLTPGLIVNLF